MAAPTPGQRALERVREAAREGLIEFALDLAGRAANEAPIETGRLRASVSPGLDDAPSEVAVEEIGDRMEVHVTFSTPYAHAQHEGYIDYDEQPVAVEAHTRTLPSGKVIAVRAHTRTLTGRVVFRNHPLGGGKKYLERPLKQMAPRYEAVLARKVQEAMAR